MKINLPVWMNKGDTLTLAHASKIWWERVYSWLAFPLAQIDVDTCDERLLSLLAYQRDIDRFPGEPLALLRLRVKWAFVNAEDAGSKAGFARIFERLEIGKIQQLERQFWLDWDVILLRINDEQLSRGNALMMRLVRQYGRTCRRYFFDVLTQKTSPIRPGRFDLDTGYHDALFVPTFEIVRFHVNGWMNSDFQPVTAFDGATYMIEVQGAVGEVAWSVEGCATVAPSAKDCAITITGPGDVTVTGVDEKGRAVTHEISPTLWFIHDGSKRKITEAEAWASSVWGRIPLISEMVYGFPLSGKDTQRGHMGALWCEWGDMAEYAWPGAPGETGYWADWWISLSPSVYPPDSVYMPVLSGRHRREEQYSSNGTVATVSLTNINAFRICAVWDAATPFQIAGFTVNGWDTPTFEPVTSFVGATYKIRLLGQFGPVTWAVSGPAQVSKEGDVTITGPGQVTVKITSTRGETITHRIAPRQYFIPSQERMTQAAMPAWLATQKGRMPTKNEMSSRSSVTETPLYHRRIGSLWSEWGSLGAYGWLDGGREEAYATSSPGVQPKTYAFVRIQAGTPTDYGIDNPGRFALAAVFDL
jgi:hypothetical protein